MNFCATGVNEFFVGTLIFAFPRLASFLRFRYIVISLLQNIQSFPLLVKPF